VIRAVLDANLLVSALLMPLGIPARILAAAYASVFRCLSSEAIAAEVSRALNRSRVQRKYHIDPSDASRLSGFLRSDLVLTPLTVSVSGVATHPEDDLILATAVSARADYLVTGDRQLLALQSFQGVQIVSPREFLAILALPDAEP
jgi:uncharacterized protein